MPLSAILLAAWMLSPGGIVQNDAAGSHAGYAEIRAERPVDGQRSSAPGAASSDEDISRELSLAAQIIRDQAPIRSEGATVTGARAQGYELVTTMAVELALDEATLAVIRRELSSQLCQNEALVRLIRLGATITYEITDTGGQVHRA